MDAEKFAYWLQGYVELHGGTPNGPQWQMIKEHLALVFNKVTPELKVDPVVPAPAIPVKDSVEVSDELQKALEKIKDAEESGPRIPWNPFNPMRPFKPYDHPYEYPNPNPYTITC